MHLEFANDSDVEYLRVNDKEISSELIVSKIRDHEIYIVRDQGVNIGWIRFGYFWDNIPFMNLIWIEATFRRKGFGKKAVEEWESNMKARGFGTVMTSTQADENAQIFYRKLGYRDRGCLVLDSQPLEIIFVKHLH